MLASQEGGWSYTFKSGPSDLYVMSVTDAAFLSQATRVRALQRAYRKAEAANPRDDAPKAGAIRNLGLLGQEGDTKALLNK